MYNASLGRWNSIDPYSQYYSPYLAMGNNPISRIDPDGGRDLVSAIMKGLGFEERKYHESTGESRFFWNGWGLFGNGGGGGGGGGAGSNGMSSGTNTSGINLVLNGTPPNGTPGGSGSTGGPSGTVGGGGSQSSSTGNVTTAAAGKKMADMREQSMMNFVKIVLKGRMDRANAMKTASNKSVAAKVLRSTISSLATKYISSRDVGNVNNPMNDENLVACDNCDNKGFWDILGVSVELEIGYPDWVVGNLTDYNGFGIEFGLVEDGGGISFFTTTKSTTKTTVTMGADIGLLIVAPNKFVTDKVFNSDLKGDGFEKGGNFGFFGLSYGGSSTENFTVPTKYIIIRPSIGVGLDLGFGSWNTNTTVTGTLIKTE